MPTPILFEEVQPFKQKWLEGLLLVVNTSLIIYYCIEVFEKDFSPDTNIGLLTGIVVSALITLLLKRLKLITQITAEGIQVRFSPLQTRFQLYRWDDIEQIFIRTYNPIPEYGGWGIRLGPSGNAYNVSGNVGLQLVLRGNYKILIGTAKADELMNVLHSLGRI